MFLSICLCSIQLKYDYILKLCMRHKQLCFPFQIMTNNYVISRKQQRKERTIIFHFLQGESRFIQNESNLRTNIPRKGLSIACCPQQCPLLRYIKFITSSINTSLNSLRQWRADQSQIFISLAEYWISIFIIPSKSFKIVWKSFHW